MSTTSIAVHSFTECKDIWRELEPRLQEQLLHLASKIWNTLGDVSEDPVLDDSVITILENKKIIISKDDGWHFANPQMFLFVQSLNLINSLSLHHQTVNNLLQSLLKISSATQEHSFGETEDLVGFIIVQLVNELGRLDLFEFIIYNETLGQDFWRIYGPICKVLPVLELTVDNFLLALKNITIRVQHDWTGPWIYSATGNLGLCRPEFALRLIDSLVTVDDWETTRFLSSLLTGIAMASPDYLEIVIIKIEEYLKSQRGSLIQAGLYCSENLILNGKLDPNHLLARVDLLASKPIDGVRHALASVITSLGANFSEYANLCFQKLRQLKTEEITDEIRSGISIIVSGIRDNQAFNFKVLCLSLLTDISPEKKEIIKRINWSLLPIAHSYSEEVWRYLENWVLAHELKESIVSYELFLTTIQELYKSNQDMMTLIVTQWFASPDLRLGEEARSVIREFKIHHFAADLIKSMSSEIVIYVTEKLLVGHLESVQVMYLYYSILENTSKFEELSDYFSQTLRELTENYPNSAKEFFDRVINQSEATSVTHLLQQVHQEFKQYQEQLKDVFVLELVPSKRRVEKYLEFENKLMRRIQEASRQDNRFQLQKWLPRVMVGRGNRTFHMDIMGSRTFSEPGGFGLLSESMELRRGEFLDPEGEAFRRLQRLHNKITEAKNESE